MWKSEIRNQLALCTWSTQSSGVSCQLVNDVCKLCLSCLSRRLSCQDVWVKLLASWAELSWAVVMPCWLWLTHTSDHNSNAQMATRVLVVVASPSTSACGTHPHTHTFICVCNLVPGNHSFIHTIQAQAEHSSSFAQIVSRTLSNNYCPWPPVQPATHPHIGIYYAGWSWDKLKFDLSCRRYKLKLATLISHAHHR